ncbi:5-oxoprolinase subunit PxpA [Croceitalea sp. MTPC9]|uniref:5-oxoprolinase subunit PxpA n=1 Tax=unclassified Croceitalea TaxID=2632280 RepID=UPI002B3B4221|nr:5-oxoprolinase subunit PxpA [Croceitalea sp. MTPC6]GMN15603.1 5-oxoprolinase subunit PxpA [Croceitalea sp. MTPC9]
MEVKSIDINSDVGEGFGNEKQLFPLISSCNIACGGHAGDETSILQVALLAQKYKVKVGAHPSYPDKKGFGRVDIKISNTKLKNSIEKQVNTFQKVIETNAIKMHHIKPHGALYNGIAKDVTLAHVFLDAIGNYKDETILYVPYDSIIAREATKQGFKIWYEAFCDRNYNKDLTLVSRKKPDSLITRPEEVLEHLLPIINNGSVKTVSGTISHIKADTFCIHGDTPTAMEILMYLTEELPKHHIKISK